jgi:chaperonin GroES
MTLQATLRPLGDNVAIVPIYQERVLTAGMDLDTRMSPGGVALPDSVDNEPIEGEVVALGDGYIDACPTCYPNGKQHGFTLKIGDRVLFPLWMCISVTLDATEYFLLSERDVTGLKTPVVKEGVVGA